MIIAIFWFGGRAKNYTTCSRSDMVELSPGWAAGVTRRVTSVVSKYFSLKSICRSDHPKNRTLVNTKSAEQSESRMWIQNTLQHVQSWGQRYHHVFLCAISAMDHLSNGHMVTWCIGSITNIKYLCMNLELLELYISNNNWFCFEPFLSAQTLLRKKRKHDGLHGATLAFVCVWLMNATPLFTLLSASIPTSSSGKYLAVAAKCSTVFTANLFLQSWTRSAETAVFLPVLLLERLK